MKGMLHQNDGQTKETIRFHPGNAGTYYANANEARNELDDLDIEVNQLLAPVRGGKFIVFHDAYQYFETVYDFAAFLHPLWTFQCESRMLPPPWPLLFLSR